MIIYAIYFISYNGIPLLSENYRAHESIPNEMLLGGLFTALQGVASEMTNDTFQIRTLEAKGVAFHIREFAFFRIVLVTSGFSSPEVTSSGQLIHQIGNRFLRQFRGVFVDDHDDVSVFDPFKRIIREEYLTHSLIDEDKFLDSNKRLNAKEIINLPHHLHTTAKALVFLQSNGSFSIADVIAETNAPEDKVSEHIESLQKRGYVGKRMKDGETFYFILV